MRALVPWGPFRELTTLHKEMDDLFTRFLGAEEWPPLKWSMTAPSVESFVRNGELVMRADLPGIEPKEVELAVEGQRLAIRGERRRKEKRDEKDYIYREVAYGRFERFVDLPAGVDTDSIKATYHDGVLEVTMKAPKEMVAKKIPITVH